MSWDIYHQFDHQCPLRTCQRKKCQWLIPASTNRMNYFRNLHLFPRYRYTKYVYWRPWQNKTTENIHPRWWWYGNTGSLYQRPWWTKVLNVARMVFRTEIKLLWLYMDFWDDAKLLLILIVFTRMMALNYSCGKRGILDNKKLSNSSMTLQK